MNSKISVRVLAELLPVIAFNVVYFLLVEEYSASRWIGWVFLHLAYVLLVFSGRHTTNANGSVIFGYPRISVAWSMFIMAAIAFAMIFVVNPDSAKWPLIIEILVTTLYLCQYLVLMHAEQTVIDNEAEFRRNVVFVKSCSESLAIAKSSVTDDICRKTIEKAYDAIRNGSVASVSAAQTVEAEIAGYVESICKIAGAGSDPEQIKSLADGIVLAMKRRESIIRGGR